MASWVSGFHLIIMVKQKHTRTKKFLWKFESINRTLNYTYMETFEIHQTKDHRFREKFKIHAFMHSLDRSEEIYWWMSIDEYILRPSIRFHFELSKLNLCIACTNKIGRKLSTTRKEERKKTIVLRQNINAKLLDFKNCSGSCIAW